MAESFFPCSACGAELAYAPGTESLACAHCGAMNRIDAAPQLIEEEDYKAALAEIGGRAETVDAIDVHCDSCGADVHFGDNKTSTACPYCGAPTVATAKTRKLIRPKALLPFGIDRAKAEAAYQAWLRRLWFAPSDLTKRAYLDTRLRGIYVPHWTYDCGTTTDYTGKRGDDYWETETYTAIVNGRPQTQTRTVRKTRWRFASGRVHNSFDDVLVPASTSLPPDRVSELEPWGMHELVPYADEYLAGFAAESYSVTLEEGFDRATRLMQATIHATIRADIGGDHQVITSTSTRYRDITFKHVLLPVWVAAYRYNRKLYRVLINARTGELQGDRPYSWIKIALLVLFALGIAAGIALIASAR